MEVRIVTYNMAMGYTRSDTPVSDPQTSFDTFCKEFANLAKGRTDPLFICVQEIYQSYNGNQVEKLQDYLNKHTGQKWWKHSTMHFNDLNFYYQESVAVFSNRELVKEQKYNLGGDRAGQAVKAKLTDTQFAWVVTAHLLKGGDDKDGSTRTNEVKSLLQHIVTFDPGVPVVVCGDFNIADIAPGTDSGTPDTDLFNQTIKRIERFDFTRGASFVPNHDFITHPSWVRSKYDLIDYIFVNASGACTPGNPSILNFTVSGGASPVYPSDHKGMLLSITFP